MRYVLTLVVAMVFLALSHGQDSVWKITPKQESVWKITPKSPDVWVVTTRQEACTTGTCAPPAEVVSQPVQYATGTCSTGSCNTVVSRPRYSLFRRR